MLVEVSKELGLCRLSARGVPIDAAVGRGGGVRVPARHGLGRVQLDGTEALDLLLSTVKWLRRKLTAAFPPEERARLSALRRRVLVGPTSSTITAS